MPVLSTCFLRSFGPKSIVNVIAGNLKQKRGKKAWWSNFRTNIGQKK